MIVQRKFTDGDIIYEVIRPFVHNQQGELVESPSWIVIFHKGSITWFADGFLENPNNKQAAEFASANEAVKAADDFAAGCGLEPA